MLYDELYEKVFSKDIDSLKKIDVSSLLPIQSSFNQLPRDIQEFFINNDKKKTYKIRNFANDYLCELVYKGENDEYFVVYILFLGQNFMVFGSIHGLIKPIVEQIGIFNNDPDVWRFEFKISKELRTKCPKFSQLVSNYRKLFGGGDFQYNTCSLFSFPQYSNLFLCYNDIIDVYDSFAEIRKRSRKLIALSAIISEEMLSAGILDGTREKKLKNFCRFIRFVLLNY